MIRQHVQGVRLQGMSRIHEASWWSVSPRQPVARMVDRAHESLPMQAPRHCGRCHPQPGIQAACATVKGDRARVPSSTKLWGNPKTW